MKKKLKELVATLTVQDFRVDIFDDDKKNKYDAFLYHEDYDTLKWFYSFPKKVGNSDVTLEDFIEMVKEVLMVENHIGDYIDKVINLDVIEGRKTVMKRTDLFSTITFEVGDGFMVDIVDNKEEGLFEAWLYHKNYGVKSSMFGEPKKQKVKDDEMTLEQFIESVEANLLTEDYIGDYAEEYMD